MNLKTDRKLLKEALCAGIKTIGEFAAFIKEKGCEKIPPRGF